MPPVIRGWVGHWLFTTQHGIGHQGWARGSIMDHEVLEAMILGVVQGIAEFLPVSSSGHLVVLQQLLDRWFGISLGEDDARHMLTNIVLHLGTLLSIIIVYWPELKTLWRRWRLCVFIVLATIPAATVGLAFKKSLDAAFRSPLVVACGWLVTAGFLLFAQRRAQGEATLDTMKSRQAWTVGFFQMIALLPGISRSGSTIAGGLVSGLRRDTAGTFSFLIAVPVIAGAVLVEGRKLLLAGAAHLMNKPLDPVVEQSLQSLNLTALGLGALTSFVVGVAALLWLKKVIARCQLHWFAVYCVAASLLTFAGIATGVISR